MSTDPAPDSLSTPEVSPTLAALAAGTACRPMLRVRIVGRANQIVGHWIARELDGPTGRTCSVAIWGGGDNWRRKEDLTAQQAMDSLCGTITEHMQVTWAAAKDQLSVCREMARTHANLQHRGFRRGAISKMSANQARNLEADMKAYRASCESLIDHHIVHAHTVDGWPKPTVGMRFPWKPSP